MTTRSRLAEIKACDEREVLNAVLRRDFPSFAHKVFQTLCPNDAYKPNWHIRAIAHVLAEVEAGRRRQIVNMPPRSLKSILISVAWVAWRLGHTPALEIVCVSYSIDLAAKHARDCRKIMQSDWYRELFPETALERTAELDLRTTKGGGRFTTSIGATLTGRGGKLIIIDDPTKPDEAASELARRSVIDWYRSTAINRLNDKVRDSIVLVMQRLHDEDLAGYLMGQGGWELLSLAAIAEVDEVVPLGGGRVRRRRIGEVLHEAHEPRWVLDEIALAMGSAGFAAQYQQSPVPAGGAMVKREWLSARYKLAPEKQPGDQIVQSWDCASKEGLQNDYSVCLTFLRRRRQLFLLDVFRDQLNFPELYRQAVRLALVHDADALLIEDAAGGTPLIQRLFDEQPSGAPLPIARKVEGDKATRLWAVCANIEAGELVLPAEAPWLADFERELLGFPGARHDDQVDALSQALSWSADGYDWISNIDLSLGLMTRSNPWRIGDYN